MPEAWWTTILEVSARLQLARPALPGGAFACMHQDRPGGHVGHHQRVGVLIVGEWSGPVAVEVERAEADRSRPRRGKPKTARTPASTAGGVKASHRVVTGPAEVGFEHRPLLMVGVDARPLPERVLQLLDRARSPRWWCTPNPAARHRTSA